MSESNDFNGGVVLKTTEQERRADDQFSRISSFFNTTVACPPMQELLYIEGLTCFLWRGGSSLDDVLRALRLWLEAVLKSGFLLYGLVYRGAGDGDWVIWG